MFMHNQQMKGRRRMPVNQRAPLGLRRPLGRALGPARPLGRPMSRPPLRMFGTGLDGMPPRGLLFPPRMTGVGRMLPLAVRSTGVSRGVPLRQKILVNPHFRGNSPLATRQPARTPSGVAGMQYPRLMSLDMESPSRFFTVMCILCLLYQCYITYTYKTINHENS